MAGNAGEAREVLDEALVYLKPNNMKDEQIIYPRTDQALGERKADELVVEMLAL